MTDEDKLYQYAVREDRALYEYKTDAKNQRFTRLYFSKNLFATNTLCLGEYKVFVYLLFSINRDNGFKESSGMITSHKVWGNLDKYYRDGWLATVRTQGYIEKETGLNQANISRWIKGLLEKNYIKVIGEEEIKVNGNIITCPVYALGKLIEVFPNKVEVYFYQILP